MIIITPKYLLILLFLLSILTTTAQSDRIEKLKNNLEILVVDVPGLDEHIEFTTNDLSLQEFIRGIGLAHELNVSVDDDLNDKVVNNFNDARVLEVFVFLCKTYSLDIEFTSNILFFKRYNEIIINPTYIPSISYDTSNVLLTLNLNKDTLSSVIQSITEKSPYTVLMTPDLQSKIVSVFIENRPFIEALQKLALTNNMELTNEDDSYFIFNPAEQIVDKKNSNKKIPEANVGGSIMFTLNEEGLISGSAMETDYGKIIDEVSKLYGLNYFLFNDIVGKAHLEVKDIDFEQFLNHLLNGSNYTFKKVDGVYLFGNRNLEGLRKTEMVRIENRDVDQLIEIIPAELKKDVDIKMFADLNAIILSGSAIKISELKSLIREIDQVVPMINIELIIVDVNKSNSFAMGMQASFGSDNPPPSSGTSGGGGLNLTLNSSSINSLITSLNGFGSLNLGQVTPSFYVNLEALESQGYIKTRQKTKLSALNGKDAEISIGSTEYYLETRNDIIGTQNPVQSKTENWKSIDADLTVTIKPIVTNDGQVVLEISVTQKDFTARVSPTAPPGNVSRTFKSIIRVKDGDMILLGGLEDKKISKNSSGLPFISRIPVLRWFFGKRTREKSTSTLNMFLKPTIYY